MCTYVYMAIPIISINKNNTHDAYVCIYIYVCKFIFKYTIVKNLNMYLDTSYIGIC